jgi:hypothetical protein
MRQTVASAPSFATRIVALPSQASVPMEPVHLVAEHTENALGVILDRGEQVVRAAAGEGGAGYWHGQSPELSSSTPMPLPFRTLLPS